MDFEILRTGTESASGLSILKSVYAAMIQSKMSVKVTKSFQGGANWLMLYGVGAKDRSTARDKQLASGNHALLWDLGYFGRKKATGYMRVSIDHQHPQAWLDRTVPNPKRWEVHGINLREDANPDGHIVLAGCGQKSHVFLGTHGWEKFKIDQLRERFPDRRIIYRPKPGSHAVTLDCETDSTSLIAHVLKGAALVVSRHSNVSCDAIIAGVPFECDDGAAAWLKGKPYTPENRLDFLRRLSFWQWKSDEAMKFIKFFSEVIN
ncbi:MAG: hypothetical protein WC736_14935 [Gallionella sp.]